MLRRSLRFVALLAAGLSGSAHASDSESFLGTWKLLSVASWVDGKEVNSAIFGSNPNGYIHYLPGNRMAAVIAYGGRKPISGDRIKASAEERAEAYATFLAYAGTYRVEADKVIHRVETSAYQNEVGSDQVRFFRRDGDMLYLDTVPLVRDGKPQVFRLIWKKVPQQ